MLIAATKRDLTLYFRNLGDVLNPLVFLLIVISLFPLGISPSAALLSSIAPGVLWVAALLAMLLSMDLIFRSDYDDGSLEQMVMTEVPLSLIVLGKMVAHWLVTGLPLVVLSPLLSLLMYLPAEAIPALALSLLLGTPVLSLLGAVGAGLTVGLKRGGLLLSILVLPLVVPVLILATTMVQAAADGAPYTGHILWLAALLALTTAFAPLAAAAGVRIAVSQ